MMGAPGEVNRELTGDEVAMTPVPAIRTGLWRMAMGPHLTLLIVALGVSRLLV